MIRGAIFDLDGTLGDTLPVCYRAFRDVLLARTGREYANHQIHAMFGPSEEGILARHCPDAPDEALADYLAAYRSAHSICPQPFPGIRAILEGLRDRAVALAIVTGKGPGSARISLERFDPQEFFPIVEAGSPDGGVKPAAMHRVLQRWGVAPRAVIGVGDSPSDIRAAQELGIASVAAAWAPDCRPARLAAGQPDRIFSEVSAFGRWLAEKQAPVKR